jgi:hypothetical protein
VRLLDQRPIRVGEAALPERKLIILASPRIRPDLDIYLRAEPAWRNARVEEWQANRSIGMYDRRSPIRLTIIGYS